MFITPYYITKSRISRIYFTDQLKARSIFYNQDEAIRQFKLVIEEQVEKIELIDVSRKEMIIALDYRRQSCFNF